MADQPEQSAGEPRFAEDIFNDALELPAEKRGEFVARVCGANEPLRQEVNELLDIVTKHAWLVQAPQEIAVGTTLNHYKVLRVCGRGGMGIVYEALDSSLGRRVALKLLPASAIPSTGGRRQLDTEARLLASLNHESIATLYSLEDCDGVRFLVMELVDGVTLADRLRDGPIAWPQALEIAIAIAAALEFAHTKHIVHRDLKPANVMLLENGRIKLLDFGIAKVAGTDAAGEPVGLDGRSGMKGTPGYMSPEQLLGNPVDPRTDLWGLGSLLFECLTGKRATATDTVETSHLKVSAAPDLFAAYPTDLPRPVRATIQRCLAVDPGLRPHSAREVRSALEGALAHGGSRPFAARLRRFTAARWRSLVVASVAILLCVGTWYRFRPTPAIALIEMAGEAAIRAIGEDGHVVWQRTFPRKVWFDSKGSLVKVNGRTTGVMVVSGDTLLLRLRARDGDVDWERPLSWNPPVNGKAELGCRWIRTISWPGIGEPVLVVCIRDGMWYSAALQFITQDNRLLAEYDHPGPIDFPHVLVTRDSGTDVLLVGSANSSARFRDDVVPPGTEAHCGFVALLEPPNVAGQAFPYSEAFSPATTFRDWPGLPHAVERSYVLIPPIAPDQPAIVNSIEVQERRDSTLVDAGTRDGRWLRLDGDLVPLECFVTFPSPAHTLLAKKTSIEVVCIRRGIQRTVTVPLRF